MKIKDLPSNLRIYICHHIFEFTAEPVLFQYDCDGDFVCLCGCYENEDIEQVHVVGFEHMRERLVGIMDHPMIPKGSMLRRDDKDSDWFFDAANPDVG